MYGVSVEIIEKLKACAGPPGGPPLQMRRAFSAVWKAHRTPAKKPLETGRGGVKRMAIQETTVTIRAEAPLQGILRRLSSAGRAPDL
jgi:hypothetical protein